MTNVGSLSVADLTRAISGYPTPAQTPSPGHVTCWLVDTRTIWAGANISTAADAAEVLAIISEPEQRAITTKHFVQDARMSLASALLKRLFICKTLGIGWDDVHLGRRGDPKHGKPCAVDEAGMPIDCIDFNISHQGGLVALVGYDGRQRAHDAPVETSPVDVMRQIVTSIVTAPHPDVMVGVDIVCVNERDDYKTIDAEGLDGWVDIYESVFSNDERWSMKYDVDTVTLLDGTTLSHDDLGRLDRCMTRHKDLATTTTAGQRLAFSSDRIIEAKLRRFYAFFCYKEAYIKLSGEALLAPWLRELEFSNVRSPRPGAPPRCSSHGRWGEKVDDVEVTLQQRLVTDVRLTLQAFEEDFMIACAVQGDVAKLDVPQFTLLDLPSELRPFVGK